MSAYTSAARGSSAAETSEALSAADGLDLSIDGSYVTFGFTDSAAPTDSCLAYISIPPLTLHTWPVMYDEASAARTWTIRATSSGRPSRPQGIWVVSRPVPRSSMCPSAAWAMWNAPDRLTVTTLSQSAVVRSRANLSIVMPAL